MARVLAGLDNSRCTVGFTALVSVGCCQTGLVPDDVWANLADPFVNGAYGSVKGRVRTYVLHQQLLRHLPAPPGTVLDVGGGAAHQSLPLARLGFDVTVLDSSPAMLAQAEARLGAEPEDVRRRVRLIEASGENADTATHGEPFDIVLCHGVLMYLGAQRSHPGRAPRAGAPVG